jgi:hypothetical protein
MSLTALLTILFAPSLVTSLSFDSREFEAAETEDQNFLATQWRALESDMLNLQQEIAKEEAHNNGFLQIRTSPVAKAEAAKVSAVPKATAQESPVAKSKPAKVETKAKPKENAQAAKMEPKDVSKPKGQSEPKKVAAKLEPSEPASPEMNRLSQTENMMKGLTGKAMLAPMLGMLEGMYQDQKKRIGEINKREQKSKDRFAKQQKEFNDKIKSIKERHEKGKLSDEFFKNETRDYTRQFKYWEGVRSRNHRQFHNALKITHGMMQREKDMISQYEAAMSMKTPADNKKTTAAPAKAEEAPEVVFMQQRKAAAVFIQETLMEVRRHLAETLAGAHALSS